MSVLHYGGCTADAVASASLTGDEVAMNGAIYGNVHHTEPREMLGFIWELSGKHNRSLPGRVAQFAKVLSRLPGTLHTATAHCEVNDIIAERLGYLPRLASR